jgi:uncharacterized protein (DUF1810 family)
MPSRGQTDNDPYDLQRFLNAQAAVFETVRAELSAGRKRSHWMWFIFPQLRGLGRSHMAHQYGITGLAEASAYVEHPVLGPRLRDCTHLVNQVKERSITRILGSPDDMKFHSSMTLFVRATADNEPFLTALTLFFGGRDDPVTVEKLG